MSKPWRLLETWDRDPAWNMGLDQALLEDAGAPPTLRFYTWAPDTLSLGYFQRLAEVPGRGSAGALVRRCTGGGAIHHTNELTFSFVTDQNDPLYRGPIAPTYERIHLALAKALAHYGIEARLRGDRAPLASDGEGTGMCFHKSTAQDLCWNDRKGIGSAQRRTGGRVLHHGSIKIGSSPLEGDIATFDGLDDVPTPRELAVHLTPILGRELALVLDGDGNADREPSAVESDAASRLGARFIDPVFVARR